MSKIKNNLFRDKEKEIVRNLSKISFSLIDTYHALTFHKKIFSDLNEWSEHHEFDSLINYKDKLEDRVIFLQKKLRAYESTIKIVLENKSAEAVKTLSMMSFIFFPLSFIAGLFGMSTVSTPIVGSEGDWYTIVYFIITVVIVLLGYFKYKRWL
jgi:magnesium transporter